jgi:ferric-dicitrate binding protein FerR (iron transport regulator)
VALRLDADTELTLARLDRAALERGAVYVDSGDAGGGRSADLELATPAGSIAHLGTQYQARVLDGSLAVGVREGRIRVTSPAGDAFADAGERLVIEDGALTREPLARTDADWQWIADVTPPFTLEGRTVEELLVWAARETGRTVVYASPEAARRAQAVRLSGTVEGLAPDEAVAAALSTTSLRPAIAAEHIRVEAAAP